MAILEIETGHYYRVLFDECMIKGNMVYVTAETYATATDRDKEKKKLPLLGKFVDKVRVKQYEIQKKIEDEIEKLNVDPMTIEKDEDGRISKEKHPEIRNLQDELMLLNRAMDAACTTRHGVKRKEEINSNATLKKCGFRKEWIQRPIKKLGRIQINVGAYNGEKLTHEFFYNRLKKYMNENIQDC